MRLVPLAGLVLACAVAACTTEVPVTREVEATRIVVQTVEVPVTREVEATRIVERTVEAPVTREVEVAVTREVEVTRVSPPPMPDGLCSDYPYMLLLGEAERDYHQWWYDTFFGTGSEVETESIRDLKDIETQLINARANQSEICGSPGGSVTSDRWEMHSWEGWATCESVFSEVEYWYRFSDDEWNDLALDLRIAINGMFNRYAAYCDNSLLDE